MPSLKPDRRFGGGGGGVTHLDQQQIKDQIDHPTTTTNRARVQLRVKLSEEQVQFLKSLGFRDPERSLWGFEPSAIGQAAQYASHMYKEGQAKNPAGLIIYWLRRNAETGEPIPMPPRERSSSAFSKYRHLVKR